MEISERARKAIKETVTQHGMKYRTTIKDVAALAGVSFATVSRALDDHPDISRETKEKVAYRKSEGCSVVEMECSALAACATFRGATWGMILYTADSLADLNKYDERNWGSNAYEYALTLCLDAVIKL